MSLIVQGEHVWLDDSTVPGGFGIPIGARVESIEGSKVVLKDDEEREINIQRAEAELLNRMHQGSVDTVDDMIKLGDLNEAGILRNLLIRYRERQIYTYIGSVLVAVNPYTFFPIYDSTYINEYQGRDLTALPPHIFAVAEQAYSLMKREKHNQCIVISGESGAGKTESTKFILQYLATVSGQHSRIEQQVLQANPILEAFGNAKTLRNDNSSRFGKYIDVHFNKSAVIEGAKIEHYLLEKSRIVNQMPDERNYHIFYRMLAGMSPQELRSLHLTTPQDYYYLSQGNCFTCQGVDEARAFHVIKEAMEVLAFTEEEMWRIFKIMAALLHLGNISFQATVHENMESCEIMNAEHTNYAEDLLGLPRNTMEKAFTFKSTYASGEVIYSPLSDSKATDVRDAFVKGLYGKTFVWIVRKINASIYKPKDEKDGRTSIGVLDIFGFEVFDVNSFEQLCINYANENLQQFFVAQIFKIEQEEYSREGIEWKQVTFQDNQDVLDMLALAPMNFIALMDEESRFPQGTDESFLHKLNANHKDNPYFVKSSSLERTKFGVVHFAGTVYYESEGILDKNRDTFSGDLIDLIAQSDSNFLLDFFIKERSMGTETRKRSPTLSMQFRRSLNVLMKTLSNCHSSFVRCIKPNNHKQAMVFDRQLCWQQLKYSGMLETVRVRKAGYSMRHTFEEFVTRYHMLLRDSEAKSRNPQEVSELIASSLLSSTGWVMGTRRIFLKESQDKILENARSRLLTSKVVLLQRNIRKYLQQKRVRKERNGAIVIQKTWRGYKERRAYNTMRRGFYRLQAIVRSRLLVKKYHTLKLQMAEEQKLKLQEQKRREEEERRREEEEKRREEEERWRKEQELRRRERERKRKEDLERRAKEAQMEREQREKNRGEGLTLLGRSSAGKATSQSTALYQGTSASTTQDLGALSSSLSEMLTRSNPTRGAQDGAQYVPHTLTSTISSLSSLLKPSPGNSAAFAVSLLAFGIALGTPPTEQHNQQQQQQQEESTTADSQASTSRQQSQRQGFVSPLRTEARGPQSSNRNGPNSELRH
ncbi:unconventional myosin-VIIa-like [Actinia tenebrosa]|uniref:Unconventional myosin-VIIa-like n=1 Tax=Actinia tenebrosa TaxID=6105 RepID=A0A6P8I7L2_ACTTE|nr:unconventional myosin-VIIa-like [Actinia tenebrosa]